MPGADWVYLRAYTRNRVVQSKSKYRYSCVVPMPESNMATAKLSQAPAFLSNRCRDVAARRPRSCEPRLGANAVVQLA